MPVTLDVLSARASLESHEKAIRDTESLGYRLVSLAVGTVDGKTGNLVVFRQDGAPPAELIRLLEVDGDKDMASQEAPLNTAGGDVVCYGRVLVKGRPCNVAALR